MAIRQIVRVFEPLAQKRLIPIYLIVLGVGLPLTTMVIPLLAPLLPYATTVGTAIVGAGVFSIMLRTPQVLEMVGEELRPIIDERFNSVFLDPDHLAKRADLRESWETVTTALVRRIYPEVADQVPHALSDLMGADDYYFDSFEIAYCAEWEDQARERLKLKQTTCCTMIFRAGMGDANFSFFHREEEAGDDEAAPQVLRLRVGPNRDELADVDREGWDQVEDDLYHLRLDINAGQATSRVVWLEWQMIQNLQRDPLAKFYFTRYCKSLKVSLSGPTGLRTQFAAGGGLDARFVDHEDVGAASDWCKRSTGLILPRQGFTIFFQTESNETTS